MQPLRGANKTRWGPTLDMLQCLLQSRGAVTSCIGALHDNSTKTELPTNLTEREWPNVAAIIQLLQPFQIATEFFSRQQSPTISLMLPILHNLRVHLVVDPADRVIVKERKLVLLQKLDEVTQHWKPIEHLQPLACYLDPRTKVKFTLLW
mgnify:FL=1